MQGRLPRKMKRYSTEPDEFGNQNRQKYSNLTLKQLKLHVGALDQLHEIAIPQVHNKFADYPRQPNHFISLHTKLQNKRNALKRLPELNNHSHSSNGQKHTRVAPEPPVFKRSNPLFVVNTLFPNLEILKEDPTAEQCKPSEEVRGHSHKSTIEKSNAQSNEFSDFSVKSIKIQRGPRLVDSELNRLTHQSTFSRRKIYSQEKSRSNKQPAAEPSGEVELLTFYKPQGKQTRKELKVEDTNQFLD